MNFRFPLSLTNLKPFHQGKTRDTFDLGEFLLVYTTDRLSTHNVVHHSLIPGKGEVLTALTVFWLQEVLGPAGLKHHLVASGKAIWKYLPGQPSDYPSDLPRQAIIIKKLKMIPVEFVWRNYLCGSLYDKFYKLDRPNPYGASLPPGLQVMEPFDPPTFTPTDKSETDEPLLASSVEERYPEAVWLSRDALTLGREVLNRAGLELVDSKLELGIDEGREVVLGDEIITPDSSRFAEIRKIVLGQVPPWHDKQLLRDTAQVACGGKSPTSPLIFPVAIIERTAEVYREIFEEITGKTLDQFWETPSANLG